MLNFLHSDLSVWRKPMVWGLRFAGVLMAWLWLITLFAAWPGRVPHDELGPVWFSFAGLEFHAPWAALEWTFRAEGISAGSAWLLRLCGLIMALPSLMLAKVLVGSMPKLPSQQDRFAYGGHLIEDAKHHESLGHAETSRVIVGHIKGWPWQKSPQLVHIRPSTECVILGEGSVATEMFHAALKGFDGTIIHIGTDRLLGGLVADGVTIRIAQGMAASCPIDPLRQVREGTLAWSDVRAMLHPCHFNERQLVLATAFLVHGLETALPHRRTLADVVCANDNPNEAFARLNGWIGKTPILGEKSKDQLQGLLEYWAQAQDQLADDLVIVRKRLWATQYCWRYSSLGEPVLRLADIFMNGPRVASFEIRPRFPDDALDPVSLPLMQLTTLLRNLIGAPHNENRRPVLVAIEADLPSEVMDLIKAVRAKLKNCDVSLLVHGKSASAVRGAFGIDSQTWLSEAFDTVIITEPNTQAFRDVLNTRHITNAALASVRAGEVVVVASGRRPVRLHAVDPAMVPLVQAASKLMQNDAPEPWSEPAIIYPNGHNLPKPKPVSIPQQSAMTKQAPAAKTTIIGRDDPSADRSHTNPLVSKDDLASSTARLKKALAKRASKPPQTQSRII